MTLNCPHSLGADLNLSLRTASIDMVVIFMHMYYNFIFPNLLSFTVHVSVAWINVAAIVSVCPWWWWFALAYHLSQTGVVCIASSLSLRVHKAHTRAHKSHA